jgi:hypothetical protein
MELPSVKVQGLPPHLSPAAVQELCSHYGAVRTRPLSGPMVCPLILDLILLFFLNRNFYLNL